MFKTLFEEAQNTKITSEDILEVLQHLDEETLVNIAENIADCVVESEFDLEFDLDEKKMSAEAKKKAKKAAKSPAAKKAKKLKAKCMAKNGDKIKKSNGKLSCGSDGRLGKGMSKADKLKMTKARNKN